MCVYLYIYIYLRRPDEIGLISFQDNRDKYKYLKK